MDSTQSFVLLIDSFNSEPEKTEFRLVLNLRQDILLKEVYSLKKTFDDFFQFKTQIRMLFKNKNFPTFPPRLPGKSNRNDNEKRMALFNQLLKFMMEDEELRHCDLFSSFLGFALKDVSPTGEIEFRVREPMTKSGPPKKSRLQTIMENPIELLNSKISSSTTSPTDWKNIIGKDGKLKENQLRHLFRNFDQDKNGLLNEDEMLQFFDSLFHLLYSKQTQSEIPEKQFVIQNWIEIFDPNRSGSVEWHYFKLELEKILVPEKSENLFGKPLADHASNLTDGFIPNIVFLCMKFILTKAIKEVGILRISGSTEAVKLMKQKADIARKFTSEMLDQTAVKPGFHNDVSSLLKMFIRELPSPVISNALFQKFFDNYRFNAQLSATWVSMQISLMDAKSRNLLYSLSLLCCHVVDFLCENQMSFTACAVCLAPVVCTSYNASTLEGVLFAVQLLDFIFTNHKLVFGAPCVGLTWAFPFEIESPTQVQIKRNTSTLEKLENSNEWKDIPFNSLPANWRSSVLKSNVSVLKLESEPKYREMVYAVLSSNQEQGFCFDEWECEKDEDETPTTAPSSSAEPAVFPSDAQSTPSKSLPFSSLLSNSLVTTNPSLSTDERRTSLVGNELPVMSSSSPLATNGVICFTELERQLILDMNVLALFEFLKEKSVFEKSQNIMIVAEVLKANDVSGVYLLDLRPEEIDGFGMDIGPTKTLKDLLLTNEKRKRDQEDADLIEISLDY